MKRKVNIASIKPNPDNPRFVKDSKFKKLVKSIKEFPEMLEKRPIIVDENMVVLGGNMRLKACKSAGLFEVWIDEATGWSDEKKKEFIIKDNVGFGEWDWDILANEWDANDLDDWGLDLPDIFEADPEAEEDDYEEPDDLKVDVVLGDLIEIGNHRLLCGDSTDSDQVAKLMDGKKADMVFTDPPYGMFLDADYSDMNSKFKGSKGGNKYDKVIGDNDDFTPELINTIFGCFDYCKEIFIWGADYFAELIPNKNDGSWFVWDKRLNESADKMYGSSFELCWSKSKHKRDIARIKWAGIFGMEKEDTKKRVHPTQKPIELVFWFMNKYSKKSYVISDLFLGSGSTMVAAHQLDRVCYGMELDPKYCQVIIDRMLNLDENLKIRINGKKYDRVL
jgi:site-specific DNA-methyltransferase (adenine-specific)